MKEHAARRHRMESWKRVCQQVFENTEVSIRYLCRDLWFNGEKCHIHLAVIFRIPVKIIFTITVNKISALNIHGSVPA